MCDVIKRDGTSANFYIKKIIRVMELAFKAEKKTVFPDVLELLAIRVTADFQPKVKDNKIHVEDIQDNLGLSIIMKKELKG